uniref:ATP synthase F0 subunit 8 n=1 Tax=Satsuma myomphala TaxID=358001 RepID=UPI0030026B57
MPQLSPHNTLTLLFFLMLTFSVLLIVLHKPSSLLITSGTKTECLTRVSVILH